MENRRVEQNGTKKKKKNEKHSYLVNIAVYLELKKHVSQSIIHAAEGGWLVAWLAAWFWIVVGLI